MTLGSLFDGIAGFPLAAAGQGIKTVWTSEIEADCIQISKKHFPEAEALGDITKIDGSKIQPVDIISFGSPCQDLSVAGKQKGITGSRSGLFMQAIRIVREMREQTHGEYPRYIIWENVYGALSSNKGEDFRRVLEEITESSIPMPPSGRWANAGMVGASGRGKDCNVAWRVLDAQFWGVPQRRKRIYLVADFGTGDSGQILFECESLLGYHPESGSETEGDSGSAKNGTLGTNCGRVVYTIIGNVIGRSPQSGGNGKGFDDSGIAPTLTTADRHAVAYAQSGYGTYKEGVATLMRSRGAAGGGSETLITMIEHNAQAARCRVRRLTPLECERLNGFPDEWARYGANGKEMSDNARYKALGNSIAVPCAERVFAGIKSADGFLAAGDKR